MSDDPGSQPITSPIDPETPNPARIYDYLLGGAFNFAADRRAADAIFKVGSGTARPAQANRGFLRRAVRLMLDQGIDQFLDLGSGIPTVGNVHEIAQRGNPAARVVYVDNEPVAVAHSRQLLAGNANAAIVEADLRRPRTVLGHPDVRRLLDFDRPVGVLLVAVLHFLPDDEKPADVVEAYTGAAVAGGYLALSHFSTDDYTPEKRELLRQRAAAYREKTRTPVVTRSRAELSGLLGGTDIVEPGVVWAQRWRPDADDAVSDDPDAHEILVGVGRIPARAAD